MKRNPLSRLLSVLLCLCLVAGMLPAALAEEIDITSSREEMTQNDAVGQTDEGEENVEEEVTITNVSISGPSSVKEGETSEFSVSYTVNPDETDVTIAWSIDKNGEIDGDATGKSVKIKASSPGEATISVTVASKGDTSVSAVDSHEIKIEAKPDSVSSIQLNHDTYTFEKPGEQVALNATVLPETASDSSVTWSSSNDSIATVNNNGLVTAVSHGNATITAKSNENPSITAKCEITVKEEVPTIPTITVTVTPDTKSLKVGETAQLTATVTATPNTDVNKGINWTSSEPDIVLVSSTGEITALKEGVSTITATSIIDKEKYDSCQVTVSNGTIPVTGVALQPSTASIPINGTVKLTATVAPSNATNKAVIWSSSDTKVATVDGNGNVAGKAKGTATITVTTEDGSKTAKCTVNVGTASAITYTVAADDTVTLKASDFNSVCNGVYGTTLDYVIFDRSTSNGTLYYDYTTKDGGTKISTSTKYYSSNSASRSISSITFVPDGKSGDKATFPYTAYDTKGQRYAGTLEITIKSPSGNVKYETAKDESVDFDSGDFDDVCRSITGSRLDYVTFTLPSSSRGTLYYDYGGKDEEKLSSSDKCYADEDDGDFGLDDITFVPKSGYTGTVTFNYSGRSTSRDSFSGTVTITISKTGSTLRYQIDEGEELDLDDSDFNDYCKDQTGANLDYVTFDLPGSSRGTLYYKYGSRDEDDISSSDKFYRSSSPRLDDVTFVPKSGYTGTVSIDFTGRSVDNDRFSGTVKIEVGDTGSGDISYTAPAGSAVSFVLSDFNDLCEDETGERLDYVTFDLPSSSRGTLYYQYGKSGEEKLSSSDKYYRSGSPRLEDVSFVPASSFSGTLEIKFSGRSTDNDRFSGTVAITYTSVKDPAIVRYTSDGGAVNFQSNDFVSACSIRGAGNLVSVKFNTPSSGTLYYGYTSPTSYGGVVNPLISFSTGTGNASISGVTYVPKAGYSGTVTLTYTGTDSKGATFTGNIAITVTPTTGSRFTDMGNYSWAAASVDFLYENGTTTGTTDTTYGPAGNITRGDFVLMLARAFNLTGGDPSNSFSDVPANSYYAQAIASAKALGIAQGGGSTFNPTGALTRQDAMVLLHRTLSRTGKTIPDASASYLSRFSDGGSVASYAQSSVAALVQAGVIQGDTSGKLNPQGSLTRAEMAVILHRVLTL